MKIKRREFLGTAAAGAAGVLTGTKVARAAVLDTDPVAMVPLGKHLKVSRIGGGTGMRGGNRQTNQTRLGREKFEALLNYEYDRGMRTYDLADLYGSHEYLGRAMKSKPRDSYVVASKYWFRKGGLPEKERPDADVAVARFLKELQMEYIDLVQIHCVTSSKWPEELRRQMDILEKLKEKGLIRAHGVSCHSLGALEAAAAEPWVDVVHARINPYGASMDGPPEKVIPVLKKIHAAGKGVIGMKIIGEGRFRDDDEKRDRSVAMAVGLGCVDMMTVGFEKSAEVDDFYDRTKRALVARAKSSG